jgi:hypothetical protein
MAETGGYKLESYPSVRAWIARVRGQPDFIPLIAEGG